VLPTLDECMFLLCNFIHEYRKLKRNALGRQQGKIGSPIYRSITTTPKIPDSLNSGEAGPRRCALDQVPDTPVKRFPHVSTRYSRGKSAGGPRYILYGDSTRLGCSFYRFRFRFDHLGTPLTPATTLMPLNHGCGPLNGTWILNIGYGSLLWDTQMILISSPFALQEQISPIAW